MESIWAILELLLISDYLLQLYSKHSEEDSIRRMWKLLLFLKIRLHLSRFLVLIYLILLRSTYPWSYLHTMKSTGLLEPLKKL